MCRSVSARGILHIVRSPVHAAAETASELNDGSTARRLDRSTARPLGRGCRSAQSNRRAFAHAVSSCRLESWSLRSTADTWVSTVFVEMKSSAATSL